MMTIGYVFICLFKVCSHLIGGLRTHFVTLCCYGTKFIPRCSQFSYSVFSN